MSPTSNTDGADNFPGKILHELVEIENWVRLPNVSFKDLNLSILSEEIIREYHIYIFYRLPEEMFVSLPHRTFVRCQLYSSIDAVIQPEKLRIICSLEQSSRTRFPADRTSIAVVAIHPELKKNYGDMDLLNYGEIRSKLL
jgi:hypothetical protein